MNIARIGHEATDIVDAMYYPVYLAILFAVAAGVGLGTAEVLGERAGIAAAVAVSVGGLLWSEYAKEWRL